VALQPLRVLPGLYLNRTPYASKTRWVSGDLVRFRDGVPQQLGGWRAAQGSDGVDGVPRCAITWRPNSQHGRYLAVGTHKGIFVYDGGQVEDVTPAAYTEGRVDTILGSGYGGGLYGVGLYGGSTYGSSDLLEAATWSMDMWGENVVAVGHDGVVVEYSAGDAAFVPIVGAPSAHALVVTDERRLMLLGADGEPNRVQWSTQEDNTIYTASATNSAGGFTLNTVSKLQCGARGRGVTFVWSETDLFGFFPTFNQFIYGYERLGQNCGACSPNSAVVVGEVAYWMGVDGFYCYQGQVQRLECDIHDFVFGNPDAGVAANFNLMQRVKVHVRHNTMFDEIWFSYPSGQSSECDRVAIFNYRTGAWSKASIARPAWADRGAFSLPMGLDPDGAIYEHEVGHTANGALIESYIESAPMELGNGDLVQQVRSFWPDARMYEGRAELLLRLRQSPRGAEFTKGPYVFTPSTERIMLATVARQLAIQVRATEPGDHWELGEPRVEITAGGSR
jgi:hypothetical protein